MKFSTEKIFKLLNSKDKATISLFMLFSFLVVVMDLMALLLLGIALIVSTKLFFTTPSNEFKNFDKYLEILNLESVNSVLLVMSMAGFLFLFKTFFSFLLLKNFFNFLSRLQVKVIDNLLQKLFSSPIGIINKKSSHERSYALINGANSLVMGVFGNLFILSSEFISILALLTLIFFVKAEFAIIILLFSVISGYLIHTKLEKWAIFLGREIANSDTASALLIQQSIHGYREKFTLNRLGIAVNEIKQSRITSSKSQAGIYLLSHLTKFFLELIIILAVVIILVVMLLSKDLITIVIEVTFFASAVIRIMPSFLRFQSALLSLKASIGLSKSTLDLADELADQNISLQDFNSINLLTKKGITNGHSKFSPEVVVEKLNFIYPNSKQSVLTNLNLVVNQGDMVAIQGKSGSGKSTLIDLILGILTPTSGKVQISGVDSAKAIRTWPGAIGYVPQNVRIIDGTIRENIAFGVPESLIDDKLIWESLEKAQISDLVTQRSGLETKVGELGFEISGGQSQRIGLARALYTRPKLIILDEATSALDEETENNFLRVLESFRENTSTLIVSHKTSSLNYCNKFLDLN